MQYLYLGSYLKIIVDSRNSEKKSTQRAVASALFTCICPELKDDIASYMDDTKTSNIIRGKENTLTQFLDEFEKMDISGCQKIPDRIQKGLLPFLNPNKYDQIICEMSLLIDKDDSIMPDTIVDLVGNTKKKDIFEYQGDIHFFLAGVIMYVLKYTKNNVFRIDNDNTKKVMKEINEEWNKIQKARTEKSKLSKDNIHKSNDEKTENIILFRGDAFSDEGLALILSKWDENNKYDLELIEELAGKKYIDFREKVRVNNRLGIILEDGSVSIKDANRFRWQLIEEIDEIHIQNLLDSVKRNILKSTQYASVSEKCMNGIVDFLAQLSVNSKMRKRLSDNTLHNCIYLFERDILKGKYINAIKILIKVSALMLEADIKAFLFVLEDAIKTKDNELTNLVSDNDQDVIYPLADALRKAAMSDKFFPDAMMLFYELSEYNKLFEKYMKIIMIPTYIQTSAGIETQMGLIKKLDRLKPEWTWHLVADLLPGKSLVMYRRVEYRYLPIHTDDLPTDEIKSRISTFISFLGKKTNYSTEQQMKLLSVIPYVDKDNASDIVDIITKNKDEDGDADAIWGFLQRIVGSICVNDEDKQKMLGILRSHFASGKDTYLKKELFSYRNVWKKQVDYFPEAKEYVQDLYKREGIEGIAAFSETIEDTFLLAEITIQVVPKEQLVELIGFLSKGKYNRFRSLLVSKLSSKELLEYIKQDFPNRIHILSGHSVDNVIIAYGNKLKSSEQDLFWKNVFIGGCDGLSPKNYVKLVKQLSKYNRCEDAIRVLSYCIDKNSIDTELIIDSLNAYDIPNEENTKKNSLEYEINILIGYLQNNAMDRQDEIAEIEKKYIHELVPTGITSPKYVFYKMANEPEYVKTILEEEYIKNKNGEYHCIADTLFYHFKVTPGIQENGSFEYSVFLAWKNYTDKLMDSGIRDKMLSLFAKGIIYTPADLDGFIMDRNVAEYVENCKDDSLITNIEVALFNSIGTIDLTPGANSKDMVINRLKERSEIFMNEGYFEMARVYRNAADVFENHYCEKND